LFEDGTVALSRHGEAPACWSGDEVCTSRPLRQGSKGRPRGVWQLKKRSLGASLRGRALPPRDPGLPAPVLGWTGGARGAGRRGRTPAGGEGAGWGQDARRLVGREAR